MNPVTFYGHFTGWSSYPTVCKGIAKAMYEMGQRWLLCDLRGGLGFEGIDEIPKVDLDVHQAVWSASQSRDMWGKPIRANVGSLTPTAIVFGFPEWTWVVPRHKRLIGYHVCDTDRVPEYWVTAMNELDMVLTPSRWCADAFLRCGVTTPIRVVHHGLDGAFYPRYSKRPKNPKLLHFCSSQDPSRKGTLELMDAFDSIKTKASLTVMTDASAVKERATKAKNNIFIEQTDKKGGISPLMAAKRLSKYSILVAPSRGEGFGLIPLEASACGLAVVSTGCTGHAEYYNDLRGNLEVQTENLSSCGKLVGWAPTIRQASLRESLLGSIANCGKLREEAKKNSKHLRSKWSWHRALKPLLEVLG